MVRIAQEYDTKPFRTIWKLSWPQLLMMVFHFFVGFVDVLVAARLGREIQAAMGIISQSLFFFLLLGIAVANGAVAAISQSIGAGMEARARRFTGLCLQLGVLLSLVVLVGGTFGKDTFLSLLSVPETVEPAAAYILGVFLWLLPIYYIYVITNAVFRARRQVVIPLLSMAALTVVNTLGDFGFGLGMWGLPNMGYRGLAWSTFGAVTAGLAVNLFLLWRKGLISRRAFPPLRWSRAAVGYIYKVAWPSGLMQLNWQSGYLVLFAITAGLPYESVTALAGMNAGLRVESLLFLPAFALNMTASILVGNSLGAGRPEEAKAFGYRILLIGVCGIAVLSACVWPFLADIAGPLSADAQVQAEAVSYLRYNLLAIPFTVTSMILAGAFNGAGATLYNFAVFALSIWAVRLPLAWFLGHKYLESAEGVWIAMLVSQFVQASVLLLCYQFGRWHRFSLIKSRNNGKPNGSPHVA